MKVSDILRVKGNTLYTITPDQPLAEAVAVMADKDIGSLVVMVSSLERGADRCRRLPAGGHHHEASPSPRCHHARHSAIRP